MTETVTIRNSQVCCPNCGEIIRVRRKRGGGTDYVTNLEKLPKTLAKIMAVWISTPMRNNWYTKPLLRQSLSMHGIYISEDAINARVSELLGLRLILSSKEVKSELHKTSQKPLYFINMNETTRVLNNGGKLK